MEKAQILIVEDDAITAMDIKNQLKNLGYGVSAKVAHGKYAIKDVKGDPLYFISHVQNITARKQLEK